MDGLWRSPAPGHVDDSLPDSDGKVTHPSGSVHPGGCSCHLEMKLVFSYNDRTFWRNFAGPSGTPIKNANIITLFFFFNHHPREKERLVVIF